ncbi:hypothetical protein QTN25_007133 [Entamoeba marina]
MSDQASKLYVLNIQFMDKKQLSQFPTSDEWTESTTDDVTTIRYVSNEGSVTQIGWYAEVSDSLKATRFLFNSDFLATKLILDNSGDLGEAYINQTISFQETPPNLKVIQYKNSFEYKHSFIFTENMPNNVGCNQIQKPWNVIYVSQIKDFTVKGGSTDQRILIYYDAIDDPFNYPYIYIDGLTQQTIAFKFSLLDTELSPFSTIYYLFTSPNIHNNIIHYNVGGTITEEF